MSVFDAFDFLFRQMIERKSDLARLEALDCGKPLDEAAWDMVCDPPFHCLHALYFCTPSGPFYSAHWICRKSNFAKFDQIYIRNY